MKIGFLNPWSSAAESQAAVSQRIAAQRIGVTLITAKDERDLDSSAVDFVISVASSVPKVYDCPSYLNVHEPTSRFLQNEFYLKNLMTYDGYLTISDSLRRFIRDLSFGIGRPDDPGFYFDTPQKSETSADLPQIVKAGDLRIVYFGTNWDRRSPRLFELLDTKDVLRIHGPRHSWPIGLISYAGPLPFDGVSPQKTYASFGLGLVLLSAQHLREGVISNRIFEIASVGAVSICPDIPWIRKWFGDSVFYFNPWEHSRDIARRITDIHEHCKMCPHLLAKMGQDARTIFEKNFSAERMLLNAVEYHEANQRKRSYRLKRLPPAPRIAVIVRCGDRRLAYIERAVNSICSQTFGRFTVIFVKYKNIDLSAILSIAAPNIDSFIEIEVPNGNRSDTLFAGLAKLRELHAEYFSVLDDDDFWLSNHMEGLFSAAIQARRHVDVAFSGAIAISPEGRQIEKGLSWKRNVYTFGFRTPVASASDITREFSSNSFVARTDLLVDEIDTPEMETAEDSVLISLIARHSKPVFSYQATAFFTQNESDGSGFSSHPLRQRDLASLSLRTSLLYSPNWLGQATFGGLLEGRSLFEAAYRIDSAANLQTSFEPLSLNDWLPFLRTGASAHADEDGILVSEGAEGFAVYGPYWTLPPGRYEMCASIIPRPENKDEDAIVTGQITTERGTRVLAECRWRLDRYKRGAGVALAEFRLPFSLYADLPDAARTIETRIFTGGDASFRIMSLSVKTRSDDLENNWFPYLTPGDCGIHTGAEIKSIKSKIGYVACTPPIAITPGHYKLILNLSVGNIGSSSQNPASVEIWSGSDLIAIETVESKIDKPLQFDVSDEFTNRAIELRIRIKEPIELSICGVTVEKASDRIDPMWRTRLARVHRQNRIRRIRAHLKNAKGLASISQLWSLIGARW